MPTKVETTTCLMTMCVLERLELPLSDLVIQTEQDRLDFVHHMLMLTTHKKHFHAPIKKEQLKRVLDAGTGTGIWAIEVGM